MSGLILLLFIIFFSIKIVKQSTCLVIERLGKFKSIAYTGLTIVIPFIDRIKAVIDLKEQNYDTPPLGFITKDNITISLNIIISYNITDPKLAVYETDNLQKSISFLAYTTIRDIISNMNLINVLQSINSKYEIIETSLNETTNKWGCKINKVEIVNINPPKDIKESFEKQIDSPKDTLPMIFDENGNFITKGSKVQILKTEGSKVIVKKLD